jgi:hypothetical protein
MVLSPRSVGLGTGKGGEMMKLMGAIFLFFVFVSSVYAQNLFDQAEIEFDIDYIDIDKVKILGSKNKGQVMAVWLKTGDVLTKTLSNSKIKYSDDNNDSWHTPGQQVDSGRLDLREFHYPKPISDTIESKPSNAELKAKSDEELVSRIHNLLNGEWNQQTTFLLFDIIFVLQSKDRKGSEYVQLTIDIINHSLENGMTNRELQAEKHILIIFAEGDIQLVKTVNNFLEEKGFKKEEY